MKPPMVELICVGTELLDGKADTHLAAAGRRLQAAGLRLARETVLPDDVAILAGALRDALRRCDALIVCGGLGPTFDDVTREAAARALERELVFKPRLYADIRRKLARKKFPPARENRRQAFLLRGARALRNRHGSAPGQLLVLPRGTTVALLPGPPGEMIPMLETDVVPALLRRYGRGLHARSLTLRLCGLPESVADERLKPLTRQASSRLDFTILSGAGQVDFHINARAASARGARRLVARARGQAQRLVGKHIFGEGPATLESAVGALLRRRRLSLSVAESCTAGLLAARLTAVPGSSQYFRGGILAYQDMIKSRLLAIPPNVLSRHGAVSLACAREMAKSVRRIMDTDLGVSITGIAGPSGATSRHPEGTIFLAVAGPGTGVAQAALQFPGDRETVRQRAAAAALRLIWNRLLP